MLGAVAADYDNDGDADLYITCYGANIFYRNQGDGRFADVTATAGVGDEGFGTGAAFGDWDLDGDLDLYVANYLSTATGLGDRSNCPRRWGRAWPFFALPDYDDDGWLDLYFYLETNTLYHNEGEGFFRDRTTNAKLGKPSLAYLPRPHSTTTKEMAVLPSGRKLLAWKIPGVAWARWPLTTTASHDPRVFFGLDADLYITCYGANIFYRNQEQERWPLCRCHDHCQRRQFNKAAARYRRALELDSTPGTFPPCGGLCELGQHLFARGALRRGPAAFGPSARRGFDSRQRVQELGVYALERASATANSTST